MPDAYKVNLQAAVVHHGHTVDYDHYNASINCCVKPFNRHDTEIIEHIRWENWNELVAMEIHCIAFTSKLWYRRDILCSVTDCPAVFGAMDCPLALHVVHFIDKSVLKKLEEVC